jgi:hypothetical protein
MVDERRAEDKLRHRLRLIAGITFVGLVVLMVGADTVGRLFFNPNFHVSEIFLGTIVGAILVLAGVEGLSRLPGGKP